jgi:hypothetical protein
VEESLDGSSIVSYAAYERHIPLPFLTENSQKPVSSLRSHFEQMANSKPKNNNTPRAISPTPQSHLAIGTGESVKSFPGKQESTKGFGDSQQITRGREREPVDVGGLNPPQTSSHANLSPSPTRALRANPAVSIPPAVTIQPPQSPPKGNCLNLTLSSTPAYLSADTPTSASSGGSSPRHFRIPSRPHTPLLEPRKSPSLPASQPPSPPPPRRSGELRRDSSFNILPPPVNRAEKPKIASKPMSLGIRNGTSALEPSPTRTSMDKSSPFSTPPSSNDSTPEHEVPASVPPRPRPHNAFETVAMTSKPQRSFEPPPAHHAVMSRRKDQELNGLGRGLISPQVTGDQRPALPARPPATSEAPKLRALPPPTSMMPPPPRPSMDRKRPILNTNNTIDSTPNVTTPKRISSTPISQLQTPPRSHGRSMTVDRTSDRVPAEFRTPLTTPTAQPERAAPSASYITQTLSSATVEYPDNSRSNRRPPVHKQGIHEISAADKDSPRIMDVCGEFLCASGSRCIRAWSLRHDKAIMTLPHEEGIKSLSMAFKPAADLNDEGRLLWVGNNVGDIVEIDTSQGIINKCNAHTRRDVIQIHRYLNQMWTIDESGLLLVWGPDSTGSPNLANVPTQTFRMPKGHTFSIIVGGELWHAAGKDVRIFVPTVDASVQFQVLQRPFSQENAGEVTSGAILGSQPDRVYLGHTDGKVSIYSRDYRFIGLVSISVYKITSLVGVGGLLWASFSTGMVYVYDTSQTPWVVKKDWHAHQDPIVKLLADRSSFWTLDRSQVISLGQDNMFKVWDGLLQNDWIGKCPKWREAEGQC